MFRRNYIAAAVALALLAALGANYRAVAQQGFNSFNNLILVGHFFNGGSGTAAVPVITTGTLTAGSSDTDGSFATTGATATVTFAVAYATAPFCVVVDASATSTVSMPVYTVSAAAITFSTVITAHTLVWHCAAKVGG